MERNNSYNINGIKKRAITNCKLHCGCSGVHCSLESRFAVPCPSERNALRNPPRQHIPTVMHNPPYTKALTSEANGGF